MHWWLLAALCVVVAAGRDDLFVLERTHASLGGGDNQAPAQLLQLVRDIARVGAPAGGSHEAYEALVADAARYVSHGRGVCLGRAQVVECLVSEAPEGAMASVEMSRVREGAVQVLRVVATPRTGPRTLDVYFAYLDAAGRIDVLEHMPTVGA